MYIMMCKLNFFIVAGVYVISFRMLDVRMAGVMLYCTRCHIVLYLVTCCL